MATWRARSSKKMSKESTTSSSASSAAPPLPPPRLNLFSKQAQSLDRNLIKASMNGSDCQSGDNH